MSEYDTTYWNRDADQYHQLGDVLRVIAEDYCNVSIDSTTHVRWREMMGLITEVDAYVDDRIVSGEKTEQDMTEELRRFDRFRNRYPHLAPEVVGEDTWRRMEQTARDVVGHFQDLIQATDYDDYVECRTAEALATAELFSVCATEGVKSDPAFEEKFMVRLREMAVSACLLDSANDLPRDVREGRASLSPTLRNRGNLLQESIKLSLPQMDMLRHVSVCREMGRAAILHAARHMKSLRQGLGR